jgi:Predicted membrane protein (DUF2306)
MAIFALVRQVNSVCFKFNIFVMVSKQRIAGVSVAYVFIILGLLFNAYIILRYFSKQWYEWDGASYFGATLFGSVSMCIHWVGGFIVNILGSIQLLPSIREKYLWFHRASGKVYLTGCLLAVIGGLMYIFRVGTVGGIEMDVAFGLYGVLMFICGFMTYVKIKAKKIDEHRRWAIRLFSLGVGSMLYRIYIMPLMIADNDDVPMDQVIRYLNTAGWLMFLPNLIVAEFVIWWFFPRDDNDKARESLSEEPLNNTSNI